MMVEGCGGVGDILGIVMNVKESSVNVVVISLCLGGEFQVLWQGSNGGDSSRGGRGGEDPRLSQVLALQEELRQKKNALEALMRRMGKSSSLNMDNISDNISDNVSETSDHLREAQGSSGAATWGEAGGPHHFSDNHYQQSR